MQPPCKSPQTPPPPSPSSVERVRGIEPPCSAWEADALPLSYTRAAASRRLLRNVVRNRLALPQGQGIEFAVRRIVRPCVRDRNSRAR